MDYLTHIKIYLQIYKKIKLIYYMMHTLMTPDGNGYSVIKLIILYIKLFNLQIKTVYIWHIQITKT
jgi:hypothetical protein